MEKTKIIEDKVIYTPDSVETITVDIPSRSQAFNFFFGDKIFMSITSQGFIFNRKDFPEWKPDDFEREFIRILKKHIGVEFLGDEEDCQSVQEVDEENH